uniref:Uncharacterized protein MANES_01G099000 n=1 Tax=Rhizophora mucronata TaxID=61149 RepID=A0A2P2MZ47_RHIMU
MAEHSIISLPMTPNSTKGNQVNSRRNSVGSSSSSKSEAKILPHYLRASTGSCHDYCKYGRKHAFEEKARHPARRVTKKPPDGQSSVVLQRERKKLPDVFKHSANSKSGLSSTPEVIKREVSTMSADGKSSSFSEVLAAERVPVGALLTKSVDHKIPMLGEILEKRKEDRTLTKSMDSQVSVSSETYAEKNKPEQEKNKASAAKLKTPPDSKSHSSLKFTKPEVPPNSRSSKVSLKQSSSKAKEVKLTANCATPLAIKLSSPDASRVLSTRRDSYTKTGRTSKIVIKKAQTSQRALSSPKSSFSGVAIGLATPRASLRVASVESKKHKGLKVVSSLKNKDNNADNEQPKVNANPQSTEVLKAAPNGDVVQEKTLHVIKVETGNKYLESDHNENISVKSSPILAPSFKSPPLPKSLTLSSHNEENKEESEETMTEAEYDSLSQFDETESMEEAETLEGKNKMRQHKKGGTIHSVDKDGLPEKLCFRRGKVIDIQSENNGPKRLKFRRGKLLGEKQNLKAHARMSLRRTAAESNANNSKPDSQKFVLRHQDVQKRKDEQGLFNDVIEETASKLAETRKSKVKALVGAFESVIFLQDGKPSPNAVS